MEVFPGISVDPDVRFGKPCIAGTRVDVVTILDNLAGGDSIETIGQEYDLSRDQIAAALRYAAHVSEACLPSLAQAA